MTQPLPLYLGPALPRWLPRNASDVEEALNAGALRENHWFDFKRGLDGSEEARRRTAANLASFAIDGGAILFGVEENKTRQELRITAQDLRGMPERVDQIARSRCDPPLYVACRPIPVDDDDQATGLLLVEIPPSAMAPHMVDGRYYGRSDTTRCVLSDAEVERQLAVRALHRLTGEQLISREIARDPVGGDPEDHLGGHIYVVAKPRSSRPDLLTAAMETRTLDAVVHNVMRRQPDSLVPNWQWAQRRSPRADGVAWHSGGLPGRLYQPLEYSEEPEHELVDVEIQDDGTIALFCGRGTYARGNQPQAINDVGLALFARGVAELAGAIGRDFRYGGQWILAAAVTKAHGKTAMSSAQHVGGAVPFSADRYVETTEAVTSELEDRPGTVTRRLVARLMRGVGAEAALYRSLLADP